MEPSFVPWIVSAAILFFLALCMIVLVGVSLLMMALIGGIAFLLAWIAYSAYWEYADRRGQPRARGNAQIVGKDHRDSELQYLYGSGSFMYPVYSNPEWRVCVRRDGRDAWLRVTPQAFHQLAQGASVDVDYVIGRSGKMYVEELYH